MKKFILPAMIALLGLQVSCDSREEERQEADQAIQKADESGEDIKVDRDVLGDDEVEVD